MKIWGNLLLIYILALVAGGYLFYTTLDHFQQQSLTLRTARVQTTYASILQSNRLLADTFFNEALNREEILALVAKVVHSDGDQRRIQRGLLYRSIYAAYQRNKINVGQIVHFHFPNNFSMLRMPWPQKSGDDLSTLRKSIVLANATLSPVHGFAIGKGKHAYRHVYPLIYHGEHIASVEVSQPYYQIRNRIQQLEIDSTLQFVVFHDKGQLTQIIDQKIEKNYITGELHQNLIRYKYAPDRWGDTAKFQDKLLPLFPQLKANKQLQSNISLQQDFSQYLNLNGKIYFVIFKAITNISDQHVGYLVGIGLDAQITQLTKHMRGFFIGTSLVFLLILVYRGRLQTALQRKKENEQRLQSIFDNRLVGTVEIDVDGHFRRVNPRYESMLGYSRDELQTMTFYDVTYPEDREAKDLLKKLKNSEKNQTFQDTKRYIHKDGSFVWVNISVAGIYNHSGQFAGARGVVMDITELKQIESDLLKERQRLTAIVEGTNAGTWEWNVQTGEAVFNERWADLIGYTLAELSPVSIDTWMKLTHPDDLKVSAALLEKNFSRELDYYECEARMRHKNGDWIWVLDRGKISHWTKDGKPLKMFGTHQDISAQKKAEVALQKAHDELEQRVMERTSALKQTHDQLLHAEKLSVIGRFSASISHEFNNPLCGVTNVIKGIKARTQLGEEDQELVALALHECERMKNLLANLQQFNKPTTDRREIIRVAQIIDDILLLIKKELKNKQAQVVKTIPANLPEIWGIPDQIKQVLINLIGNAGDALGPEGGTITISAAPSGRKNITISIEDTGSGIDSTHLKQIFEPFFTTKAIKGTGLGLSVSYGIIKSHGGDIDVQSELGKGTTFTLTLPLPIEKRQADDSKDSRG
ncbi:MAG: PAS domain S-box protein [Thermodesulfobacteriota bacterium]|nr:PAS domain S-box protein [Thermodesulfobacteriota bacterium]